MTAWTNRLCFYASIHLDEWMIGEYVSEPKKLWTGAWMGIPAHVEMIGDSPVPFLAGRRAQFERDVLGILGAAVVGLAADERCAVAEIGNVVASVAKELDPRDCDPDGNEPVWLPVRRMRDRLAKLEQLPDNLDKLADESDKSAETCDSKGAHETASNHYGMARGIRLAARVIRNTMKGSANGEASTK